MIELAGVPDEPLRGQIGFVAPFVALAEQLARNLVRLFLQKPS